MTDDYWIPCERILPPEGRPVMTKIDDDRGCRNEGLLMLRNTLWWSGGTYVYYTPTHWKPA